MSPMQIKLDPDACILASGCYFARMLACVERELEPPFRSLNFVPPHDMPDIYGSTKLYTDGVKK